jgi:predicted Fe-S protein YdhL (DUF1289 family)
VKRFPEVRSPCFVHFRKLPNYVQRPSCRKGPDNVCMDCLRTMDQIMNWSKLSTIEQEEIEDEIYEKGYKPPLKPES